VGSTVSFLSRSYFRHSSRLTTGADSHRLPVDLGADAEARSYGEPTQATLHASESLGPSSPSPKPTASFTVLVADDAPSTLQALVELLEDTEGISCVAAVDDAQAAIAAAAHYQPDVALLDVRMPEGGGLGAALGIRDVSPRTKLLAYSVASDRGSVVQMLRSGALGYVIKGAPAEELLGALRRCAAGDTVLSEGLSEHLIAEMIEQGRTERLFTAAAQARYERVSQLLEPGATTPTYQPIISLQTGEVVGYEALAHFSSQPLASTEEVFAEAHKVGLGVELELHAAMLAVTGFAPELRSSDNTYLAVNASPGMLYRPAVLDVLCQIPSGRTVVEITEQREFESYDQLHEVVRLLHDKGMRVAVDDAGSGFAGLRRLVDVRPEIVKLDQGLVSEVGTDPPRRAMVAAMRHFADDMGITVVAEGIETQEQLRVLREIGIDCGQGYLLGRPGPLPPLQA